MIPHDRGLIGFTGYSVTPKGYVEISCTFRDDKDERTIPVKFLVVDCSSAYNAIVGRPTLNALGAVVSTPHLAMKFHGVKGMVVTIRGNENMAKKCHKESFSIRKGSSSIENPVPYRNRRLERRKESTSSVMTTTFNLRADFEHQRLQPEGSLEEVQIEEDPLRKVKVRASLPPVLKDRFVDCLRTNKDLFAWTRLICRE